MNDRCQVGCQAPMHAEPGQRQPLVRLPVHRALAPGLAILFLWFGLLGCVGDNLVEPPPDALREAQNEEFLARIQEVALHGDWFVTRGYKATDNLVVHATQTPLSHAGLYDRERGEVIEAEGKGIHTSTLLEFVDKSHRLLVIRPRWATDENRAAAVQWARDRVGEGYDFLGTLGVDVPGRYYCSELTVQAYADWRAPTDELPAVIEPGQLYLWGQVLYDTQPRASE